MEQRLSDVTPIAVDWSGAVTGATKKIWLAEAKGQGLARLECGRTREQLGDELVSAGAGNPQIVIGLDFAFSLPSWFFQEHRMTAVEELWALAGQRGEEWIRGCEPPFWGRAGKRRSLCEQLRRTDREVPVTGGSRPKSAFQVSGAGSVGAGSLRGMSLLLRLREHGFRIWPFHADGAPVVIEIYPRLLTGAVRKSNGAARSEFLRDRFANLKPAHRAACGASEDAFDAAVSALVMKRHAQELQRLPALQDEALLEGAIWQTGGAAATASAIMQSIA